MFLLDTNACIRLLNGTSPALAARLRAQRSRMVRLCSIVKAELLYGARHSERVAQNLELLQRFFAPFECLVFDDACAEQYGVIRADLAREGSPIGPNDLLIAATAKAYDLTLVTHNVGEFCRVPGLRVSDWETEPNSY